MSHGHIAIPTHLMRENAVVFEHCESSGRFARYQREGLSNIVGTLALLCNPLARG